ncbi:MAG TPA: proline dehydrogenase family protein [Thermoleophilaceae bacterium]|nr:proline dehydrogenase family protein [Thermoleophilaceae bacterium]
MPETEVEPEVQRIGRDLHAALPGRSRNPVKAIDARAMEMASRDDQLRAALFRLVDVTPACRSLDDLAAHLGAYLEEVGERPPPIEAALRATHNAAGRRALGLAAAAGVRHMAHRFIVGESPKAALRTLRGLWDDGVASSVDLLGEATVTREEADRYAERCHEALDALAGSMGPWPARPALECDSSGSLPRVNLSVKVSALTPLMRPEAPEVGREDAAERMRPLLRRARDLDAHLHIDMESLDALETTMELVFELLDEEEFADGPSAGVVLQAYLRDSPAQLDRLLEWADGSTRTPPLTVRLVKGAYWDHEVVEARQHGWQPPVFEVKAESDRNFEALTARLLDARPGVRVAIASHNLRSVAHAVACNRASGADDADLELQILRGLGDELQQALAHNGLRVRAYCPVGDLVAGMAYLVRRLLENTSNDSFLGEQQRGASIDELLAAP